MESSTLHSIEDKAKTNTFKITTISFIILLVIFLFIIIVISINGKTNIFIILSSIFICIFLICIIGIPFFLRKKYATSMMVNELGIFTYNNKNEPVATILYKNINSIKMYDIGTEDTNWELRIQIKDENGNLKWKKFPQLYYMFVRNKNELRLHFLQQAGLFSKKIEIEQWAINHFQSLIKK